jgi:hypothetical protein
MKLVLALFAGSLAAALAADLPVRQVILYKHGVGYFERSGELKPGETARLDFRPSEMDDVLKSLTVQEGNGGKVSGVRYDSSEPLAQRLADFPFRLGDQQPLSAFLDTLKGARVEVRIGQEAVAGAIVTARQSPASMQQPEKELLTLLLDNADLRSLDLASATSLRFQDPALQAQLREYLAAVSGARSREQRSVYIDSTGSGGRSISASYVIPMPVWKSSYRLLFTDGGGATLEGWAIVDNVTGGDWNNVRLAVVSGRPVSFISRLYEPRYVQRPTAGLPEERAQAPVLYQGAISDNAVQQKMAAESVGVVGGLGGGLMSARAAAAPAALRQEARSTVIADAESRDLGELFEYSFASPVSVRRGESAMFPFVQQKITARKLLIYSDLSSQYPMNAAELTNDTGKTLDGGPITIYDGSAYTGEALVETLKASDKRLISYATDLGTRITTRFDSTRDVVREAHFRRGILTTRQAIQETRTYTVRNVDQKAKVLVIEHTARPDYKLVNAKPIETTASAYRFEVKLAAGATEKFPVAEERVFESTYSVASLTPDLLASYVANNALSETVRKALETIAQRKRLIAENDSAINLAQQQFNEFTGDQQRLRQNIDSLNRVSGQQDQVQQYARQLAAQETQLAGLRDRLAELRKKKAALESELNALIEKMEF